MQRRSTRIALACAGIIATCMGIYALWSYIYSFQEVVFRFNSDQGYVEIVGADTQKLYPVDAQPVRLKKGDYSARNVGKNIKPDTRTVSIGKSTTVIENTFNYTDAYLQVALSRERPAIEAVIYQRYPKAQIEYTLTRARLYHQGEFYGALLVAKDPSSDNSDTLRILAEKKDGTWQLRSTPPVPILSQPLYQDVDRAILLDINRAK